ncbi:unnamed protein product [Urochloa humidicola]
MQFVEWSAFSIEQQLGFSLLFSAIAAGRPQQAFSAIPACAGAGIKSFKSESNMFASCFTYDWDLEVVQSGTLGRVHDFRS